MIIALFGNNDLKPLLAKAIQEKAPNINFEVKSMADLPNYRPNAIGEQRDNWIILDAESVSDVEKYKALTIGIGWFENDETIEIETKYGRYFHMWGGDEKDIIKYAEKILVSEKLIYPQTV